MASTDQYSRLDYRFGWRWLLPESGRQTVYLYGFSGTELEFILSVYPELNCVALPEDADIWWLHEETDLITRLNECAPKQVVVIGSRPAIRAWRRVLYGNYRSQRYGMLPADNPRIVVPLAPPRAVLEGLHLYRPGRLCARWASMVLGLAVRLGIFCFIEERQLLIANRTQTDLITPHTLYLGNPEPNRKTIALPYMPQESERRILKVAETTEARYAVEVEARTLRFLANSPVADRVPYVFNLQDDGKRLTLKMEYRARTRARNSQLYRAAHNFLVDLSLINREERLLKDVLTSMALKTPEEYESSGFPTVANASLYLQQRADACDTVLEHLCHGDFSPWNCSWTNKGFFVYDWEMSRERAPALTDAFYFAVAPYILVPRSLTPKQAREKALHIGYAISKTLGIKNDTVSVYWYLWIISKFENSRDKQLTWLLLFNTSNK
jgi:hypothetical protein